MTNQQHCLRRPHRVGLLGGLTTAVAQLFTGVGARLPWPMPPLRRLALRLLLVLAIVLRIALPEAQPVYADTPGGCSLTNGCPPATTLPAPELLYLTQGGRYAATAAQVASLRNLENQAVEAVLALHGLPAADDAAVRTWGRADVLAQLYLSLFSAINTSASERTTDQQNAVDWITAVAKRQNVAAAQNAAREYVKWAGLGRDKFDSLLRTNPTKAQLEAFLSGSVVNFDNTATALATEGWCVYRSPAPYADEYKGYNVPTCINHVIGIILPPTPSYDQFVKWGAAKANYSLLSSQGFQDQAKTLSIALGIAVPLGAAIAGASLYATSVAIAAYLAAVAAEAAVEAGANAAAVAAAAENAMSATTVATSVFRIVAAVALAFTLIAAIATAIIVGINVTDAAKLPGKLAELVDTARNTTPDAATLISSTDAKMNLLSIFVGATTPMPSLNTCDNAKSLAPGMYEITNVSTDNTTLTSSTPCLNPTAIPAATATDPQFLVKAKNTGVQTQAASITVKDTAANTTTTARLSNTWFISTANGATVQTLRLAYTDWAGKQQNAWLIGNATAGYSFLTYAPPADTSTTIDPKTCVTSGICGADGSIKYIGADGQQYSASVLPYQPPTGTPIATSGAEGSPLTLKANNFAPGGAVSPITYQWNFKDAFCNGLSCNTVSTATGDTVSHIWQGPGTYSVDLVATDKRGAQATTRLQVAVSSLPPTLIFAPACASVPAATCNPWRGQMGVNLPLLATIAHAGVDDRLRIVVNWGDGQQGTADISSSGQHFMGDPMTITSAAGGLAYNLAATHRYASTGVYTGTVTVVNLLGLAGDGGTIVRTFSMNTSNFPVVAWGSNTVGETSVPAGLQAIAVAGGRGHSLALKSDGTVVAWGCSGTIYGGLCTLPAGLSGVTAISAASYHSLALKSDGTVVAWGCATGYNYGQCTVPAGLSGVKAVTAGFAHSLALNSNGTVVAWGCAAPFNQGQCTIPAGLSSVKAIATGVYHNLALKNDGTVVAWGGGNYTGERTVPAGLTNVIAIAAGGSHSLALKGDGTVVAWGDNAAGENNVPAGLSGVVAIAAGGHHNLALKNDGTMVAWGCTTSNNGQCTVPAGLSSIVSIGAGYMHSLALAAVGPATGVAASAVAATQPATTTEGAAAPAVVETAGQGQRLFLPLVANTGAGLADAASAAGSQTTASAAPVVTGTATLTTTPAVAPTAAVTPAQPPSPLAVAAPVTPTLPVTAALPVTPSLPVTVATDPVVTASLPVSAQGVVTTPTAAQPVSVTTTQPVTPAVDAAAGAAAAQPAPDATDQNQRLFLPVVKNLAGTVLGSPGGIGVIVLLLLGIGGLVWQRRRSRP